MKTEPEAFKTGEIKKFFQILRSTISQNNTAKVCKNSVKFK